MAMGASVSQDLSSVFDTDAARLDRAQRMTRCMVAPLSGSFCLKDQTLTLAEPDNRARVILPMSTHTACAFEEWMLERQPSYIQTLSS